MMRQWLAMALLLCGLLSLGASYAGEIARAELRRLGDDNKPRPTPQMMAPRETRRPELNQGGRVSYALIDPAYVTKGGY